MPLRKRCFRHLEIQLGSLEMSWRSGRVVGRESSIFLSEESWAVGQKLRRFRASCLRGNPARIHVFNRYAFCKLNVSEFISALFGLNMPKNEALTIICWKLCLCFAFITTKFTYCLCFAVSLRTVFCFRASCMGSSKSKFQLSNADVYRNAGQVVTQKCMVSDNLNKIGHTWSLFLFSRL